MATNEFYTEFAGQAGVRPRLARMTTSNTFNELITPGYLNRVAGAGVVLEHGDFLFSDYSGGQALFVVTEENDILTLQVYSPNDNSLVYSRVRFVAKSGSNENSGQQLGYPKLTIQAAINDLGADQVQQSLVIVLDNGVYDEALTLVNNIDLWAPNAKINASAGYSLTFTDNGSGCISHVRVKEINPSSGDAILQDNPLAQTFLNADILDGNVSIDGEMLLKADAFDNSTLDISATGILSVDVESSDSVTVNNLGSLSGSIGLSQYGNNVFGDNVEVQGRLIAGLFVQNEVAGRTINVNDVNSAIVYNNAADGNFVLPATVDEALPIGSTLEIHQLGNGKANINAGAGVTIISLAGALPRTLGMGGLARCLKQDDAVWLVFGSIEPQP